MHHRGVPPQVAEEEGSPGAGWQPKKKKMQKLNSEDPADDDTSEDDCDEEEEEEEEAGECGEGGEAARSSHESEAKTTTFKAGGSLESGRASKSSYTSPVGKSSLSRIGSSDFDKSSTCDDSLNVPDGQLSDPQRLAKYVNKLSLEDVMSGSKMGNQRHHAIACIEKMQPSWGSQLKGHVKLFDWASSLSPSKISAASMSDLTEAVLGLQDKVTEFPSGVLCELWRKSTKELIQSAKVQSFVPEAFDLLWDHVRTYSKPEEEKMELKQQILKPPLCMIQLPVAERCALWSSVIMNELLIPILMEGSPKVEMMMGMLTAILGQCQSDLVLDLADEEVGFLADLQDFSGGLLAVVRGNPLTCWKEMESVDKLRKEFRTVGKRPLTVLASCVAQQQFYMDKVTSFSTLASSLKVHKGRVDAVLNYLSDPGADMAGENEKSYNQEAESLGAVVQDVLFLAEELQPELVEDIQSQTLSKVEAFWLKVQPRLADENLKLELLHQLLADSTIAFPNAQCLNIYRSQLTSFMTGKQSEQKMSLVMQSLTKCSLEAGDLCDDAINELQSAVSAAKGLAWPDASTTKVE